MTQGGEARHAERVYGALTINKRGRIAKQESRDVDARGKMGERNERKEETIKYENRRDEKGRTEQRNDATSSDEKRRRKEKGKEK